MNQITRSNGLKYTLKENKDRFLYPKEYFKVFDAMKSKQQHTTKVLINTGARINEARHIEPTDIDYERKVIILRVTKTKAKKGEKKGKPRWIPISTQFSKYLKKWFRLHNKIQILSTPAYNIGLKKATTIAGIKNPTDFSAHNMRKTFENYLLALGVDGLKVCAHVGHDPATAVNSYITADLFNYEDKMAMRDIIGDLYVQNNNR